MYCKFCGNKINTTKCTFCGANIDIYDGGQSFFTEDDIAEWQTGSSFDMPTTQLREPLSRKRARKSKGNGFKVTSPIKLIIFCASTLIAIVLIAVGIGALLTGNSDSTNKKGTKVTYLQTLEYIGNEVGELSLKQVPPKTQAEKNLDIIVSIPDVVKTVINSVSDSSVTDSGSNNFSVSAINENGVVYISANEFLNQENFSGPNDRSLNNKDKKEQKVYFSNGKKTIDFFNYNLKYCFYSLDGNFNKDHKISSSKEIIVKGNTLETYVFYVPVEDFLSAYSDAFYGDKDYFTFNDNVAGDGKVTITKKSN